MAMPVDALVTGFTKSPALMARSLASLRRLKHEGILRNIHYVTWDDRWLDPLLAPLDTMPEISVTRVPQPDASGSANQRGLVYQVKNLEVALDLVKDDVLVLKWRPDFVARHAFLREKLLTFASLNAVPDRTCLGVAMPAPLFQHKIWIPWADSNQPFFYEDAAFLGMRQDIGKLVTALTSDDIDVLSDDYCGWYAHIVRYTKPFVGRYPLFENYLRQFRLFRNDMDYRMLLVPYLASNGFYWHVLVAHAWILYSQFHVDIGSEGDLVLYANNANRHADWSRRETLRVASPYDDCMGWRDGTKAGLMEPSVKRAYGRLMDDSWQKAIFTGSMPDFPRDMLTQLMTNIAFCRDGRLAEIEADCYRGVEDVFRRHPWPVAVN